MDYPVLQQGSINNSALEDSKDNIEDTVNIENMTNGE